MRSRETVRRVLGDADSISANIFSALQNIVSGNAPSRQDEYLCLMTATGCACPSPERSNCLNCGYEIFTKTAMHTLMREYVRLNILRASANEAECLRYTKILETAILPAVSEMLAAAQILYPESDNADLLTIVENGIGMINENIRISN